MRRERVDVLGVAVDAVDRHEARHWIESALSESRSGGCAQVVTLNPEYVIAARRDVEFARAIAESELVVADGIGVLVAAKLFDRRVTKVMGRVTGLDLCDDLATACARHGASLFLLGGRDGTETEAASALRQTFAGLRVGGCWAGGTPRPEDDEESVRRIARADARVVLVAYGAPTQVLWIDRNRAALGRVGVRIAVGVGGAFDYLSGQVPRAPGPVRRLGLEWLFRLVREPWRWRRQRALLRFAGLVVVAVLRAARGNGTPPSGQAVDRTADK